MEKALAALKRLQRIDEQLTQLRTRQQHLPQRVATAQRDLRGHQALQQEKRDELQHYRQEIARQELDLRSQEEHIGRLRRQLTQVKTNREYQTLLAEIKSLEADVSRLEESILEAMGEADELAVALERFVGEGEGAAREVEAVTEAVAEEGRTLEGEIAELERDRQSVTQLIDQTHLTVYDRLRQGLPGRVVVAVQEEHCQGCHLPLTPQTISQLMANRELITCHRCGRILYLERTAEPEELPRSS